MTPVYNTKQTMLLMTQFRTLRLLPLLTLLSIVFLIFIESCNDEGVNEVNKCDKARQHISDCLLSTPNHLVYFPNWESYCTQETPDKLLDMTCEQIKEYYFDD